MKKIDILMRLKLIAMMPGSHRAPFVCCDLVDQEHLYSIQNSLAQLMLDVALDINTGTADSLISDFPYLYETKED